MLRGIQIIGVLIGFFFIYQGYILVKQKKEDITSLLLWTIVGTGIIATSLYPGMFDYFLGLLQMKERPFAILTIGILTAYILLFQFYKTLRNLDNHLSKLNEELTLLRYKLEKKEK